MPPLVFALIESRNRGRPGTGLGFPPFIPSMPLPAVYLSIYGVTKDSTGAVLGSCAVDLYRTADDVVMDRATSDASGNYEFRSASLTTTYYIVAYKAGSPDVAGTTVNTLVGV